MDLGERLQAARRRLGYASTRAVAAALETLPDGERPKKCSFTEIGRWERGESSAPAEYLAWLARQGESASWLLTGTHPPASDAEARLDAVRLLVRPGAHVDARVMHAVSLLLAAPGAERAEVDARLARAADLLAELRQERRPDGRSSG